MGVTRFRDYNLVSQPVLWQAQITARGSCNNFLLLNFSNSQIYFYIKPIQAGFCCDSLSISEIITISSVGEKILLCRNFSLKIFRKFTLIYYAGAASLLVEGAALVFGLTLLARIVPVDLLIANVAERSAQPGHAGLGRPVAHAAIPVEADVDECRFLLGDRLRELVGCPLFGQLGLRPG